jgi:formylglycine-generating enzyme required for sulfatase activity
MDLSSLTLAGLLASPFFAPPADATGGGAPSANACPADMRLVEADHSDAVMHDCREVKNGFCVDYTPGASHFAGRHDHVRACMDVYEAPNVKGDKPIVMLSSVEAAKWCADRGKRLCSEYEWESACEGPQVRPWVYGWKQDPETCNSGKLWRPFDAWALMRGGEDAAKETERLWQGDPSGARAGCVSQSGVYDLNGNVEEWVTSSRPRIWPTALMGGFWAKGWTQCRGTNWAHEPTFRFYEVGFRCCKDPSGP